MSHPAAEILAMLVAAIVAPLFVTGWRPEVLLVETGGRLRPKIHLWLTLIIAQAALWVGSGFFLFGQSTEIWPKTHLADAIRDFWPLGVLWVLLVAQQVFVPPPLPPRKLGNYNIARLHLFGASGMLVAGWAVFQMYVVRSVWDKEALPSPDTAALISPQVREYLIRRQDALVLLFIAALILAFGVLAGAALRTAVNATSHSDYFAEEYIIVYGALYSILLMIAYTPVYATFFAAGTNLSSKLCTGPPATLEAFKQWSEGCQAVNETLGLSFNSAAVLGPSLSALLPVLSAWFVNLLGRKK